MSWQIVMRTRCEVFVRGLSATGRARQVRRPEHRAPCTLYDVH
jgi:hypothetical protein